MYTLAHYINLHQRDTVCNPTWITYPPPPHRSHMQGDLKKQIPNECIFDF